MVNNYIEKEMKLYVQRDELWVQFAATNNP